MRISDWSQTVLFRSIEDVRARLALALQQVATDDGEADADRPEVLLRAAVDHAETAHVHGPGRDRGAEIGDQRPIAQLRDVPEHEAMDGLVRGDVHIRRTRPQVPARPRRGAAEAVGI